MTLGPVIRRAATAFAAVAATSTVAAFALATPAFATGPTAGSEVPGSALPIGTVTAGPFSSGQVIQVQIPANSTLGSGAGINIVECAAPGGVAPTATAACDGNTIQGDTIFAASDGSVSYTNSGPDHGYTVYALPNSSLGEGTSGTPVCNLTNECVLYIGENQNDFTQPHFFSQPFFVKPVTGNSGTPAGNGTPGAATPEAPLAIGLPLAAAGVIGGILFLRRRQDAAASSKPSKG
jgi:hypothetical protein